MRPSDYPVSASHPLSAASNLPKPASQSSPSDLEILPSASVSIPPQDWSIRIISSSSRLRCRPTELYLGSSTKDKQLGFWVSWDENVYEESVVREWLSECQAAAEWYLGRDDDGKPLGRDDF